MPEGLNFPLRDEAQYFGTFPLYTDPSPLYFSLFINCEFWDLVSSLNLGLQTDDRIVVVTHPALPRSHSTQYASQLISQHSLHIDELAADMVQSDSGEMVIRERHKFGGRPFCIQEPVLPGSEELFAQGYRQLLQIDFPSPADGRVSGNWPFGDGIFNLFWKQSLSSEPYFWYLQG